MGFMNSLEFADETLPSVFPLQAHLHSIYSDLCKFNLCETPVSKLEESVQTYRHATYSFVSQKRRELEAKFRALDEAGQDTQVLYSEEATAKLLQLSLIPWRLVEGLLAAGPDRLARFLVPFYQMMFTPDGYLDEILANPSPSEESEFWTFVYQSAICGNTTSLKRLILCLPETSPQSLIPTCPLVTALEDQASLSIGDLLYIAVNSFPSLEDPEFSADLLMWQKDIKKIKDHRNDIPIEVEALLMIFSGDEKVAYTLTSTWAQTMSCLSLYKFPLATVDSLKNMAELASSNRTPDTGMDIIIYNLLTSNNSQAIEEVQALLPSCVVPHFADVLCRMDPAGLESVRSDTMITYATSIQDQPGMGIIATTYLKDQANCKEIIEDSLRSCPTDSDGVCCSVFSAALHLHCGDVAREVAVDAGWQHFNEGRSTAAVRWFLKAKETIQLDVFIMRALERDWLKSDASELYSISKQITNSGVMVSPSIQFLSDYVTYHFVRSRNSHHRIVTAVMQLVSSDVHAPRLIFKLFIDVLAFLERPTPVFTVEESITIMKKLDSIVSSEILEENEVMAVRHALVLSVQRGHQANLRKKSAASSA